MKIIIREATKEDAKGIGKVHVDCWRTTYKQIVSDDYLKALSYEQRTGLWMKNIAKEDNYVFVAENEKGEIVGFADGGKEQSGNYQGYDGDITSIYILETYQGLGIGKKLLEQLFAKFQRVHIHSAIVKVLEANDARFFYEKLGATVVDDTQIVQIGDDMLKLMVYGWRRII